MLSRREIEQSVDQLIFQRIRTPEEFPAIIAFPIGDDNSALRNRFKRKQQKFEDKILCLVSYFFDILVSELLIISKKFFI